MPTPDEDDGAGAGSDSPHAEGDTAADDAGNAGVEPTRDRPVLVYDDDCGFCTWSARHAVRHGSFALVGFSELTDDQRARLPPDFESCAHVLTPDAVHSCGAAAQDTLERIYPVLAPVFDVLDRVPGYRWLRERLYRWIADHRDWFGRVASCDPPARQ